MGQAEEATQLLMLALEDLGAACAVLDANLVVVAATPTADAMTKRVIE